MKSKDQDPRIVEKAYDTVAKEYAEAFANEHDRKPKDREVLRRFSREIGDRQPVWDLGCGCGQTAAFLKSLGVCVSGMDLSQKMLDRAESAHPGIRFRRGDILDLGLENNTVAGIVAFYAIVHFSKEQVETAFRQIYRALQPGGIFLLTFHIGEETLHIEEFLDRQVDVDFMFFTTGFIYDCLNRTGFEKIETIERDPYPEVEYQSRRAYVFAVKPMA